jgi:hypothetical protein
MISVRRRVVTSLLVVSFASIAGVSAAGLISAGDVDPAHYEAVPGDTWQNVAVSHGLTGAGSGTDATVSTAGDKLQRANRVAVTTSDAAVLQPGEIVHVPEVPPSPPTTTITPTSSTDAPTTTTTPPTSTTTGPTSTTSTTEPVATSTTSSLPAGGSFSESFETSAGFFARFDYGRSGFDWHGNPAAIETWRGDHNAGCDPPGVNGDRTVHLRAESGPPDSELFWYCAPGNDPAKGHVMTSINTVGYQIVWFSPARYFTNVKRVCWSQNLTSLGSRKWTNVVLVVRQNAEEYGGQLGMGGPGFGPSEPNTGIFPHFGTFGVKIYRGSAFTWVAPGTSGNAQEYDYDFDPVDGLQDEATRYRHCAEEVAGGIRVTQDRPGGSRVWLLDGQFPDGDVRVVFQDDNYDPPKGDDASDDHLTWHWDDVEVTEG